MDSSTVFSNHLVEFSDGQSLNLNSLTVSTVVRNKHDGVFIRFTDKYHIEIKCYDDTPEVVLRKTIKTLTDNSVPMIVLGDGQAYNKLCDVKTVCYKSDGDISLTVRFGGEVIMKSNYLKETIQTLINNSVKMVVFTDGQAYNSSLCNVQIIYRSGIKEHVIVRLSTKYDGIIFIKIKSEDIKTTLKENMDIINSHHKIL